jgi:hypothetical protein
MAIHNQNHDEQNMVYIIRDLPAGIYFYRITTDSTQATGKMILMK